MILKDASLQVSSTTNCAPRGTIGFFFLFQKQADVSLAEWLDHCQLKESLSLPRARGVNWLNFLEERGTLSSPTSCPFLSRNENVVLSRRKVASSSKLCSSRDFILQLSPALSSVFSILEFV